MKIRVHLLILSALTAFSSFLWAQQASPVTPIAQLAPPYLECQLSALKDGTPTDFTARGSLNLKDPATGKLTDARMSMSALRSPQEAAIKADIVVNSFPSRGGSYTIWAHITDSTGDEVVAQGESAVIAASYKSKVQQMFLNCDIRMN
jgi:hypothetical protein